MRIVAGKFRGRDLMSPADKRVRPTAEHVRAAILDLVNDGVRGARALDLFAGTGAMGLEAISRGARSADFVEFRPGSLHSLKANIASLRLLQSTRVFKRDAVPFTEALEAGSYELAFADPPYESKVLDRIVGIWRARPFARILAVEHARAHDLPTGAARQIIGDSAVTIYRA